MSLADMTRRAAKLAIDHSPTILTSIGVIGTITTAYLAGRASIEAADLIRLKEGSEEDWDEVNQKHIYLDSKERAKQRFLLVWKLYVPTVATGAATIVCIIGANHVGSRRAAGLAAAYTITEKTFEEYKAKVVEKIGKKKEQDVEDEIAQDRVTASYHDDIKLYGVSEGELCYDKFSDRFFLGSVEGINAAVNSLNNTMNHDGYASLADLYRLLEMEVPSYAESIGWNHDRLLEVRPTSTLAHGSRPAIVMVFNHDPSPDYGRFH
jgi:hypothetical protein